MPPIYKYSKILKHYINPHELPNKNIYEHPEYPDSPQMETDSFELGKLPEVPEYPYHYLVVEKLPDSTPLLSIWANLDRHLREFIVAIWETIDILVSTLLLQDPQAAANNYKEALHIGTLVLPSKLPKEIIPYDRAKEINPNMFKYYCIKNWNTMYNLIHDPNWLHAKSVALQRSTKKPHLIGKLFDAQAEAFGMRMFNLPKIVNPTDVLGALSQGLENISLTEMAQLQEMLQERTKLSGVDVHLMDEDAQNRCRR